MVYDLLVKNGLVVDGTGRLRYRADVGVREGRIAAVGRLNAAARRTIDADGLVVAPGIIDTHCHYDAQVLWDPFLTSSCWHGVTSVVTGNCGFTLAPCRPEDRDFVVSVLARVEDMSPTALRAGLDWSWADFPEYLDRIEGGLGLNVAAFVGHTALRRYVMGEAASERAATEDEVRAMQAVLRRGMAAGAIGFSTSIGPTHIDPSGRPVPSRLAAPEELVALAGVLAEFNSGAIEINPHGVLRGLTPEDKSLLEEMALVSGRPVQWDGYNYRWDHPESHRDSGRFMDEVSARGGQIYGQTRLFGSDTQFTLRRTGFFEGLDLWRDLMAKPLEERRRAFADPGLRPALRHALDTPSRTAPARRRIRWHAVSVLRAARPENRPLEGRPLTEIAAAQGKHVADVLLDLALAEDLATEFRSLRTLPEDEPFQAEIIRDPHAILGNSDAGAHVNSDCNAGESTYCLAYWVRERGVLGLEDAVRRLTSVPAALFGLADRGAVRPGFAADLMLFDPAAIDLCPKEVVRDFPGGETRYIQRARGITHTIVNGEVVVEEGRLTGARAGRLLRGGKANV